jgi:hypothetical protein
MADQSSVELRHVRRDHGLWNTTRHGRIQTTPRHGRHPVHLITENPKDPTS